MPGTDNSERIAIVGVGGIFPGAPDLDTFWKNIAAGVDSGRHVPPGRWYLSPEKAHAPWPPRPDRVYSTWGCFIEGFKLDPDGLGLDANLLSRLDPMFHLGLHAARAAYRNAKLLAGVDHSRVGVILGNIALPTESASAICRDILGRTFVEKLIDAAANAAERMTDDHSSLSSRMTASARQDAAARLKSSLRRSDWHPLNRFAAGLPSSLIAQGLGLGGIAFTLDAACASSLYSLKFASEELLSHRADAMLAGGMSRPDCQYTQMGFSQLQALSRQGRCAPLSSSADGLVVGEGAGVFVLKRLSDAVAHSDQIYGIIAGIGLSNDRGANLLAPHSEGQLRAMRSAYQQAGWKPGDVDLIECHATGTPVGDAVEISSLHQLWEHEATRPGQCVIGGVKSNVGHLLTGAGAAGLMKVLYALRHKTLPPTANFQQPAEKLASPDSPFRVLSRSEPWQRRNSGNEPSFGSFIPRRATINAFGFGGINAHVLIEEWNGAIGVGSTSVQRPFPNQTQPPIAIVGLDAHVGTWDSKRVVQESRFQGKEFASQEMNWWGSEGTDWFQRDVTPGTSHSSMPIGGAIQEIRLPIGQFRIPPLEMQDMLPQQQLMLKVAAAALQDGATPGISCPPDRTGVFVGIELDPNTTNFHFRWSIEQDFEHWTTLLGLELSEDEADEWLKSLKDAAGPPLTPNRVMGNLGGIVASRLAREFDIGGPSFTVSCGGGSDVIAMHLAAGALERGELDQAIVGGVELSTDPRWHAFPGTMSRARGGHSADVSDAVILRRLSDAVRDHQRCYAVIQSPQSIEHSPVSHLILRVSTSTFPETGCANVAGNLHLPALSVFHGLSCDGASAETSVEYADSVTGLASIVLRRRSDRLRQPVFHHHDRSVPQFDFEEIDVGRVRRGSPDPAGSLPGSPDPSAPSAESAQNTAESDRHRPLGELPVGLFVVDGESRVELVQKLEELQQQASDPGTVEQLAVRWHHRYPPRAELRLALTMVARSPDDLRSQIQVGRNHLQQSGSHGEQLTKRMFLTPDSHSRGGRIAFVFPGSGNAFRQMGRTLLTVFPEVLRCQQSENEDLPGQFRGGPILNDGATVAEVDHKSMIFSQVAIGTAICDLLAMFGVRPSASIGYSLGESAALFGLRAWTERDEMLQRMHRSSLFGADLVEPFDAARRAWNLPNGAAVPWLSGIIDRSADEVRHGIRQITAASGIAPRLYLLIVNTPRQCVIGGDRSEVERLARDLKASFVPLSSPSTVHCEVLRQVEHAYRELHLMQTSVPVVESERGAKPIDFYSTAWGRNYDLSRETAAQAIVAQAVDTIDFPRVIEQAYTDGVRLFVEIGPGSSCTKMIDEILGERPHMARAALPGTSRPIEAFLELLAELIAQRVPVDLPYLYRWHPTEGEPDTQTPAQREVVTRVGGVTFEIPAPPGGWRFHPVAIEPKVTLVPAPNGTGPTTTEESLPALDLDLPLSLWDQFQLMNDQRTQAHEAFLRLSSRYEQLAAEQLGLLASAAAAITASGVSMLPATESEQSPTEHVPWQSNAITPSPISSPAPTIPETPPTALSREQCMEFAIGKIGHVLGRKFAEIDNHPTRVRLPDEPLMLVDRILTIEGEPLSMTSGRVVTEHDIHPDAWYLDCGRIPTCIAVESGQADLFLSGWLGIDLETKGLASYRLLDAVVTFHDALPQVGKTIHYDIRVLHFFRQGTTYLFRFEFDATVDGRPLLTMREGCAGFFTEAELAGGKGIIHTALDKRPRPGVRSADWSDPVPMAVENYDDRQLLALRKGDLAGCFGPAFSGLPLRNPVTLPGLADVNSVAVPRQEHRSRMWLIDRVLKLDPVGGKFGMGTILGELDIRPDDWFLTCHFCDDQVMPGTLMYECCLHTLRIFLLRLGWIGESGQIAYEPIPEIRSRLKCRGQVLAETKKVWYEVTLKEIGYGPPGTNQRSHEPKQTPEAASSAYCLADALMYADGKPIVEITDMSVRLSGLTKAAVEQLWSAGQRTLTPQFQSPRYDRRPALFDTDRITAFAIGKPSDAFGDRYLPFDDERKIARLPGPPFQFLDRIVSIQNCEPWVLQAGGEIVAQYDVPPDAWYFASNRQRAMPFAVLLETALQPCGWLAAYVGSALTSDTDISFRNLGGTATQFREVTPQSGTLTTTVKMARVSNSAGMIIQHYDFDLRCDGESVYTGNTYFGFFSKAALSNQIGIRDATPYQPTAQELETARRGQYPPDAPFPDEKMRMIQTVECLLPAGGPHGKGCIVGTMPVDPASWFFKAHFYQDPVVPGSLGLESFWQLLKVFAADRWQLSSDAQFETPSLGDKHEWVYRGQVVPKDRLVTVTAVIRDIDDDRRSLIAEGFLSVDGRVIYQMKSFSLTVATRFNSLG